MIGDEMPVRLALLHRALELVLEHHGGIAPDTAPGGPFAGPHPTPLPALMDPPAASGAPRPSVATEAPWPRTRALGVHLLTATGAVFAMLSLLAAVEGAWSGMFQWLLLALVVDGIDGPLARRWDVGANAARFDGAALDLIIDYLTYVFIPAYALYASGLVPGWAGWGILIVVPFASALYFADTRMKVDDGSFEGFPGCWNMVALVVFVLRPDPWLTLAVSTVLAAAMFLPLRFVHPVRTARWRPLTLAVMAAWLLLAFAAAWRGFGPGGTLDPAFALCTAYLLLAGVVQQGIARHRAE